MHLLFDLDGTLIDSQPGILNCFRHALEAHDLKVPADEEFLRCIGPPIRDSITQLLEAPTDALVDSVLAKYRERYTEVGLFECELYPGIETTLRDLQGHGHTLHVATSKAEIYAQRIIEHFGLPPLLASVNGSGLDGSRSNKAELVRHILRSQTIAPEQAVMIGDRSHDMIGAAANGIPSIGALWGYGSGRELMESGATLCARIPGLLPDLIATLG